MRALESYRADNGITVADRVAFSTPTAPLAFHLFRLSTRFRPLSTRPTGSLFPRPSPHSRSPSFHSRLTSFHSSSVSFHSRSPFPTFHSRLTSFHSRSPLPTFHSRLTSFHSRSVSFQFSLAFGLFSLSSHAFGLFLLSFAYLYMILTTCSYL